MGHDDSVDKPQYQMVAEENVAQNSLQIHDNDWYKVDGK
jgi:hypothetical protein